MTDYCEDHPMPMAMYYEQEIERLTLLLEKAKRCQSPDVYELRFDLAKNLALRKELEEAEC